MSMENTKFLFLCVLFLRLWGCEREWSFAGLEAKMLHASTF